MHGEAEDEHILMVKRFGRKRVYLKFKLTDTA